MHAIKSSYLPLLLSALLLLALQTAQAAEGGAQRPLQPLDVAKVLVAEVADWDQFTTRLQAPEQVELRPRVSGVIDQVLFNEGAAVKKGDLLVKLDQRPFAAEVKRLDAQLAGAQAALEQARTEEQRSDDLRARKAISAEQADNRRFQTLQRSADVAAVEAALEAARLNLTFTEVRAPINGRVSNAFVTAGNNVAAGQTVLTRLVSTERVYAYFDVDERTWYTKFAGITAASKLPAQLQLTGDSHFSRQGVLDFIDNQVNPRTGTLRVRASFAANDERLRPGAFARIRIAPSEPSRKILVPERAIGTDLKARFVLTVNDQNVLEFRPVTLGVRIGELRVIESGLNAGDRIAVNGPARVGPGMPIQPREVTLEAPVQADNLPQPSSAISTSNAAS